MSNETRRVGTGIGRAIVCCLLSVPFAALTLAQPSAGDVRALYEKPAFGYRIDYADHSVVLSGDTRVSENLIRYAQSRVGLFAEENSPPIKVLRYRVRDLGREYEISNLEIGNSSSRTIHEVEFTWVVISREGGNVVSRSGLSFVRKFPNTLRSQETARLPFVVARVPKILMGSVNKSTLGLVVSDVIFADGMHWKKPPYHPL